MLWFNVGAITVRVASNLFIGSRALYTTFVWHAHSWVVIFFCISFWTRVFLGTFFDLIGVDSLQTASLYFWVFPNRALHLAEVKSLKSHCKQNLKIKEREKVTNLPWRNVQILIVHYYDSYESRGFLPMCLSACTHTHTHSLVLFWFRRRHKIDSHSFSNGFELPAIIINNISERTITHTHTHTKMCRYNRYQHHIYKRVNVVNVFRNNVFFFVALSAQIVYGWPFLMHVIKYFSLK